MNFRKNTTKKLRIFLANEYKTQTIYPDMYDIFNALNTPHMKKVHAVILGQDPYHGPNQAHGLCFSVKKKSCSSSILTKHFFGIAQRYRLYDSRSWRTYAMDKTGVLLLNTVLTVRKGQANSHANKGWEILTDRIISLLNNREEPIVFFIVGKHAQNKAALISNPQPSDFKMLPSSPFSADYGFFWMSSFF